MKLTLIALFLIPVAFVAGFKFGEFSYEDRCLDMGGGRNPGNHPICVIENQIGN